VRRFEWNLLSFSIFYLERCSLRYVSLPLGIRSSGCLEVERVGKGERDSAVIEELRVCVWFGVRLEWDWVSAAESGFWETWREGGAVRVMKGVSIVLSIL